MDRQASQPARLHLVPERDDTAPVRDDTTPVRDDAADQGGATRRDRGSAPVRAGRPPGTLGPLLAWWSLVLTSAVLESARWGVVLSYVVSVRFSGAGPLWVPRSQWLWHGLTIGAQGLIALGCLRAALRLASRPWPDPRRTAVMLLVTGVVVGIAGQHLFDVLIGVIADR